MQVKRWKLEAKSIPEQISRLERLGVFMEKVSGGPIVEKFSGEVCHRRLKFDRD